MTRVQMDLIDMRTRPDHSSGNVFKWILQLKDHFTKFCWAQPLETKEAREVHSAVRNIFFNFGPPRILQSDNGREFVNDLMNSLEDDFPGILLSRLIYVFAFMVSVFNTLISRLFASFLDRD